jgi:hypothetical protein
MPVRLARPPLPVPRSRAEPTDAPMFHRRAADDVLTELRYNGARAYPSCGSPCTAGEREELAHLWRIRKHKPAGPGVRAPMEVTTLTPPDPSRPDSR